MKIGYLVPEFPGQTHIFFWREVQALRALGCVVQLISTRKPSPITCRHAFAQPASLETHYVFPPAWGAALLTLLRHPIGGLRGVAYILGLKDLSLTRRLARLGLLICAADLRRLAGRRGLEHIHVHSAADAAHLTAVCRRMGGPTYSLTLHGDLETYGSDHRSKMEAARFVAVVGSHLRTQIVEKVGVPPEKCLVTFMGVETDNFKSAVGREFVVDRLHVATVARLHAAKGHRHALAAVRAAIDQGCDIQYTIVGDGPHRGEIEQEISRLDLDGRVTLLGTRSEQEVLELLNRVDAFILPSVGTGEAWPVSIMEAMSCGLPVISSIIGATPEMITDGVDGLLVAMGDERGLTSAIVRLARDVGERRRIGEAARRKAVASFDCRTTARRLADAIRVPRPDSGAAPPARVA